MPPRPRFLGGGGGAAAEDGVRPDGGSRGGGGDGGSDDDDDNGDDNGSDDGDGDVGVTGLAGPEATVVELDTIGSGVTSVTLSDDTGCHSELEEGLSLSLMRNPFASGRSPPAFLGAKGGWRCDGWPRAGPPPALPRC
jgi:hypothetical protein